MAAGPLIALDVGDIRVGIALADPTLISITPFGTFKRPGGEAEQRVVELVKERAPVTLVVGLPLSKEGQRTEQCDSIERFVRRVVRRAPIAVEWVDEHLSSVEAEELLRNATKAERAAGLDAFAAVVILRDYLARR